MYFAANEIIHKGTLTKYRTQMYLDFLTRSNWSSLIPRGEAQADFGFCGFYVRESPELNLDIVVLNTNLYYKTNISEEDPCSQV